ncbi:cation:proton antiporter domain-containing protein [Streptomyces phaeochromogenes]|uniref:cation:proton antiporter domain-containing protein n=1 Tax=Streptomyces phaeochromogenes TaxID=1923 RepID=UPI00371B8483
MNWELPGQLLLDLAVIITVAHLFGAVARRLGQPVVIGEIVGAILLGPTLLHGELTEGLFRAGTRPTLQLMADIGICAFMFLVGLGVDRTLLSGQGRLAGTVALSSIALPFGLGTVLALYLLGSHPASHEPVFVLFLGTAMSVTAFPVLARILTDRELIHTPIGGIALAVAAVDDVVAWTLLALVAALADGAGDPWRLLLALPYAGCMIWVVRPLLAGLVRRRAAAGRSSRAAGAAVLVVVPAGVLLSAKATDLLGLHLIFGAFLFGAVLPREGAPGLRRRALPWLERLCSLLLLPVFFALAGMKVDLSSMDATAYGELGLILLAAIGGKFGGAYLGARANGVHARHATVLAVLVNTRGLTELIVLSVGLQIGVLSQQLYSLMVVMALITTAMTGVVLHFVYPPEQVRRDVAGNGTKLRTDQGDPARP